MTILLVNIHNQDLISWVYHLESLLNFLKPNDDQKLVQNFLSKAANLTSCCQYIKVSSQEHLAGCERLTLITAGKINTASPGDQDEAHHWSSQLSAPSIILLNRAFHLLCFSDFMNHLLHHRTPSFLLLGSLISSLSPSLLPIVSLSPRS